MCDSDFCQRDTVIATSPPVAEHFLGAIQIADRRLPEPYVREASKDWGPRCKRWTSPRFGLPSVTSSTLSRHRPDRGRGRGSIPWNQNLLRNCMSKRNEKEQAMTDDETRDIPRPTYTMGYNDEFQKMLDRRNAKINAAHLLPYLEPGLHVLDLGCGPGTISVGLADAVKPGELHGIDREESQIEMARAAASAGGHSNAFFQTGDVTDLPFGDDSFDVAHCHALLMHVPHTRAVLAEVKRVLKPGGLISGRELIGSSSFAEPELGGLSDVWRTFLGLLEANGAHPEMGKELKRALLEAGFTGIHASASFESFSTAEDVAFFHASAGGWFFSSDTVETAEKHGLATREQFENWRRMMDEWKESPGAFAAIAWGEALGRRP